MICAAPIPFTQGPHALTCGSLACAHRLAATPGRQRCANCAVPLSPAQRASGVCGRADCRVEWLVRRPIAQRVARAQEEGVLAEAHRSRSAAELGVPREDIASYPIAILPRNRAGVSRLPVERRHALEGVIRAALVVARGRQNAGERWRAGSPTPVSMDHSDAQRQAQQELAVAACSACRGSCCRQGGNHAFIDGDTMLRHLEQFPGDNDETIVARYLGYLGDDVMVHGCVYQQATGCSLPRELRADLCNRYYCEAFAAIRHPPAHGSPVRAYFVHRTESGFVGGRFVEIERRRPSA